MKKWTFVFLCLFVGVTYVTAQTKVSGVVVSSEDGQPVIGATVKVTGTSLGTVTDLNGQFVITAPQGAKSVIVSYVGSESKEVLVAPSVRVALKPSTKDLEEVIVVGYGSGKKVGTTIGSIAKVSGKELEARPQASALESLQGQVAGLQVYTSSGDPGTIQSVRLHGIGSLAGSNTPLYILDGIAVAERTILAMNPNTIESVNVLKDASATSIYGSRASNGVIYITTKKGSLSKSTVTARAQYGVASLANKSFYNKMMNTDQLLSFWQESGIKTSAQITALKASLRAAGMVQANDSLNNFKWIDFMQKDNRPSYQADLEVSGGSDKTTYYVSGSIYKEDGTAPGAFFERYSVRSNVQSKVNNWLRFGANSQLSLDKRQSNPRYNTNSSTGGLSFLLQPYYSPTLKDGSNPDWIPLMNTANPYYFMKTNPDQYNRYGVNGNGFMEIEPIRDLKIRSTVGIDLGLTLDSWKRMASYLGSVNNGSVGESTANEYTTTITNTIEYAFKVAEKHNFIVLAGQEAVNNNYKYYYAQSSGQTDDRLMHLNNGIQSTFAMSSNTTESAFLSYFGRIDYSYGKRFYLDASVRNDASSRFGANNRNATFWATGAMWNLKNESFMEAADFVNALSFKVSYGTQGNSSLGGDYLSLATVSDLSMMYNSKAAWALSSPGNPDLKWETQRKLTVAVNTRLLNMLNVGVEVYQRTTDDLLMDVPIPSTTGFQSVTKNVGSIQNNGVDLNIGVDILKGKDYYLGVNATFNYNSEKVVKLFDGRERWQVANTGVAYVVGKPIMFYYPIYAGVDPADGKMQWYKPSANVDETTKDPNNVTKVFDANSLTQNTGIRRYAPIAGGFGINGSFKGFTLTADFAYMLGKNLISNDRYFSENPRNFSSNNTSSNVLDYWKQPGDVTKYPAWTAGTVMQFDTHLLENASFMRLKNLTLGYSLPTSLLKKTKVINGVKVYVTGRNLLTFTNKDFQGIDPEVDSNLSMGRVGNSKQFMAGIELNF